MAVSILDPAQGSTKDWLAASDALLGDLGEAEAGQQGDVEDLLDQLLEAQKADGLAAAGSTAQTPQSRSSSRSISGRPPKVAVSRTCESPTKASAAREHQPAGEPRQLGDRLDACRCRGRRPRACPCRTRAATAARRASAASGASTGPPQHGLPESTSIRTPPLALFSRQPPGVVGLAQRGDVAHRSSTTQRPFRWQRSSGASSVMNGGVQRGTKLCSASSVARQEKLVATSHSSPARRRSRGSGCRR